MKKKDKKKFKRKDIRLKNISIDNIEHFENMNIIEEKRAKKKKFEKGEQSSKANLVLKKGRIIEVKSNNYCNVEIDNKLLECSVSGRLKMIDFNTRTLISVGDFVNVDFSQEPRIEELLPRKNTLSRFVDNSLQTEIVIASNIDQVIITAAYRMPDLKLGLIDRYICAAKIAGISPIICINKIDLAASIEDVKQELLFYEQNNFKVIFTSIIDNTGLDELRDTLINKDSVFSGHSGAGKSSLINILQPEINLKVAEISEYHQKGVHTTTSSKLIPWSFGGYLVDTPGIKTFSLHSKQKQLLPKIFPGFAKYSLDCKFQDCSHTHEIQCGVLNAVENGYIPEERYNSYLRILETL